MSIPADARSFESVLAGLTQRKEESDVECPKSKCWDEAECSVNIWDPEQGPASVQTGTKALKAAAGHVNEDSYQADEISESHQIPKHGRGHRKQAMLSVRVSL